MTYSQRNRKHDIALSAIEVEVGKHGFTTHPHGIEENGDTHDFLDGEDNEMSRMLRWKPDRLCKRNGNSMLLEAKSAMAKGIARGSIIIEARAYDSLCSWGKSTGRLLVAWCVLDKYEAPDGRFYAAWVDELPQPRAVIIPERFDFAEQYAAMEKIFPEAVLQPRAHNGGSGTPYVEIPLWTLRTLNSVLTGPSQLELF